MTCCTMAGTLSRPAERIVSLAPSLTETVFCLGLEKKLVGVTEQCDVPPAAVDKPVAGTFSRPDIERISQLEADLVLGLARFHSRLAEQLVDAGIPLITFDYRTVDDVFSCMREIARLADADGTAAPAIRRLRDRLAAVRAATHGRRSPRAFRLMTDDPLVTPSLSCYQTDAMHLAGAVTMHLDVEEPYTPVSLDEVAEFDPEVILACGTDGGQLTKRRCKGCRAVAPLCVRDVREFARKDVWKDMSACRQGRIHAVPCGVLCRPGPKIIDGIEMMTSLFST